MAKTSPSKAESGLSLLDEFEDSLQTLDTISNENKEAKVAENKDLGPKICYFYKNRKCKFVGKKSGQCKFQHPKKCQKFMENGPKSKKRPLGCDPKTCQEFHPKICTNSLKTGECPVKDCQSSHLKGTKKTIGKEESTKQKVSNKNEKKPNPNQIQEKESFLVLTNAILSRLDKMEQRMRCMEGMSQPRGDLCYLPSQSQHRQLTQPLSLFQMGG